MAAVNGSWKPKNCENVLRASVCEPGPPDFVHGGINFKAPLQQRSGHTWDGRKFVADCVEAAPTGFTMTREAQMEWNARKLKAIKQKAVTESTYFCARLRRQLRLAPA